MDHVQNSGEAPAPPSIRAAVISLVALYVVTTIHHLYGGLFLSSPNRLLVPALLLLPFAAAILALVVYRRTRSRAALWTSATIALVLAGWLLTETHPTGTTALVLLALVAFAVGGQSI